MQLTVAFDGFLPVARWGPLFHVLCLEQPDMVLRWKPVGFPTRGRPLLGNADVGLFLEPPAEEGLDTLVIESSPMVVVMAVGHPLAGPHEVSLADVVDQPFPNWPELDPRWRAFWSLDEHRGGPPALGGDVTTSAAATDLVAAGAAIATLPEWAASGLQHPGIVSVVLRDGPVVTTRLVWRTGDEDPIVRALVDLAAAWTALREEGTTPGSPGQG